MKKFKTNLAASALSISMALPAIADEAQISVAPIQQFSPSDTRMVFEQDAKPMQLVELSQQEMKETEGAWLPLAAYILRGGIVGGAASFTAYGAATGDWTTANAAYVLWGGFVGGAMGSFGGTAGSIAGGWAGSFMTNRTSWCSNHAC
ncbi:MAG: hypothetical protein KZQ97_00315 [Candidatus Thiodiazotropha sp. (ex Dulcina madagascariensis)]|nr:hypothetical protein [Candidatus Thiodiazotropha sp. (ex Dulcina madagascariensis)]